MFKTAYHWMGTRVHSRHATLILGILFYLEAICFLPTDPMLIIYCMERRHYALYYALVATIASVLGGITGYFIGYFFWCTVGEQMIHHPVVNFLVKPETFKQLCSSFKENQYTTLLLAGIPPIPYKAATLTAGFCQLSLLPFIICSFIVRGARFFLLALIIKRWGVSMKEYVDRYLNAIAIAVVVVLCIAFWWLKS